MSESRLDHLVVAAPNLKAGVLWVRDALGATPELGGEHAAMGTHNCLLRLGESAYLEVIAPDPNAPAPSRPRWFALDGLRRDAPPRLAAWVARTPDIVTAQAACGDLLGRIEPMSRGALNWQITISDDGRPPLDGVAPMLIQWANGAHPCARLRDSGCELLLLDGFHPQPAAVARVLEAIGFDGEVKLSASPSGARLVAHVRTPQGVRRLGAG